MCKTEFTQLIFNDLNWSGLNWPAPVRVQSQHLSDYRNVLNGLRKRGLLWRCFKSRWEIPAITFGKPFRGVPLKPFEEEVLLESGRTFSLRLSLDAAQEELGGVWNNSISDRS